MKNSKFIIGAVAITIALIITTCIGIHATTLLKVERQEHLKKIVEIEERNVRDTEETIYLAKEAGYQEAIWDVYFENPRYLIQNDGSDTTLWKIEPIEKSIQEKLENKNPEKTP